MQIASSSCPPRSLQGRAHQTGDQRMHRPCWPSRVQEAAFSHAKQNINIFLSSNNFLALIARQSRIPATSFLFAIENDMFLTVEFQLEGIDGTRSGARRFRSGAIAFRRCFQFFERRFTTGGSNFCHLRIFPAIKFSQSQSLNTYWDQRVPLFPENNISLIKMMSVHFVTSLNQNMCISDAAQSIMHCIHVSRKTTYEYMCKFNLSVKLQESILHSSYLSIIKGKMRTSRRRKHVCFTENSRNQARGLWWRNRSSSRLSVPQVCLLVTHPLFSNQEFLDTYATSATIQEKLQVRKLPLKSFCTHEL